MDLIKIVEQPHLKEKLPQFNVGDNVDVHVKIVEGDKERIQVFSGTVIAKKGSGINEMFAVRRIVAGEGVERVFPIHAPSIAQVKVTRRGRVRRAKLYYLRDRVGKAVKVRERIGTEEAAEHAEAAAAKKAKKKAKKAKDSAAEAKAEADKAAAEREKARKAKKDSRKKAKKAKDTKKEEAPAT